MSSLYSGILPNLEDLNIFPQNKDELIKAATNLRQWGCCARCVLRYIGVHDPDVFRMHDAPALAECIDKLCGRDGIKCETVKNEEKAIATTMNCTVNGADVTLMVTTASVATGDNSTKCPLPPQIPWSSPCIACLGILEDDFCCPAFVTRMADAIRALDYEFSTFLCSISLPVCLLLREHAIWTALCDIRSSDAAGRWNRDAVASAKDVWKWINGPILAAALGAPFDQKSEFEVVLDFEYERNNEECSFLYRLFPNVFQRRKRNRHGWEVFNRANVARAITGTKPGVFRQNFACPPGRPSAPATVQPVHCQHGSLYIAGRYNKFSRELSQTPWLIDGIRKTESSVEELICEPVNKVVMATEYRFSASGREDVDVRMLGNGRPFVIELVNPRRVNFTRKQLQHLQASINGATSLVAVRHLQVVAKDDTTVLKEGEEEKRKRYIAVCWSQNVIPDDRLASLADQRDVVLAQATPIRVLHRRPLATRPRTVYTMSARRLPNDDGSELFFELELTTQAGTYVKEFVHGDLGRTVPCLGVLLGTECDILELDVVAVELDWPKPVDDEEDNIGGNGGSSSSGGIGGGEEAALETLSV